MVEVRKPATMVHWHHSLHQVTGHMARCFGPGRPTIEELEAWIGSLKTTVFEMQQRVKELGSGKRK